MPIHDTMAATPQRKPKQRPELTPEEPWSIDEARELYQVDAWGQGFFDINEAGHVVVRPHRENGPEIDIHEVVEGLQERGINTPVLIGFMDLLAQRIDDLNSAFQLAIRENDFQGRYCAVYPIKVNQQRHLAEQIHAHCTPLGFGFEVGSKPELLAVLGLTTETPDMPIICNGFKEHRYIEFVALARKLGRNIIPVVENLSELDLVLEAAERHGVRPRIGIRAKLDAAGAGRWRYSSGARAKFGLAVSELLEAYRILDQRGMTDCLELLHCHIGSQIHDIRSINAAVNELSRIYVELVKMGANLKYLDVGGGLGVDYDGSQTDFEYSMNYTLEEYANTVVYRVMANCDDAGVAHPTIVTECGRAMVAHHNVLVFDVLGCNRLDGFSADEVISPLQEGDDDLPRAVADLLYVCRHVNEERLLEFYHDALQSREEAMSLFRVGHLSLEHRAVVERLFWVACTRIRDFCRNMDQVPEELQDLETRLSDTYFGNLSIFQSLPDAWAIDQLFPIMPIHRLDERPTRRATIADITCDSDGKIDRFIDLADVNHTLELHPFRNGEKYYIGAFIVGAYQETLGDLHNLFGDTHLVHVRVDESGQWWIDTVVEGDTIREVLQYVQYETDRLHQHFRKECEHAVRTKQLSVTDSRTLVRSYEVGLYGYTYLE